MKDKLFSIISHDLRNPMATMQSYLKLLSEHQDKLSGEEKQRLMMEAQESADNVTQLLYNLLQWSKSQMNLLQFNPEKINVMQAIDKIIRLLQPHAHLKNIKIEHANKEEWYVMADKEMFDFIIRNLLSNAIKFSHRSSVIKIESIVNGENAMMKIIDTGIGLSKERLQQIMHSNGAISRRGTAKKRVPDWD